MSPCERCPIFDRCEKESEQLLYCRHVEMLKKIGQMRGRRQKRASSLATPTSNQTRVSPKSELLEDLH